MIYQVFLFPGWIRNIDSGQAEEALRIPWSDKSHNVVVLLLLSTTLNNMERTYNMKLILVKNNKGRLPVSTSTTQKIYIRKYC